ncbi:MAG: putative DNA-binding domain-containing protein [Polyangiaceae bacterium]
MQRALEGALAELTLGAEIAPDDRAGIAAWLARHQVEGEDAQALSRDFPRLLVYRKLVRGNLQGALRATIPRTLARLGARFALDFDAFLLARPPVSHVLRDVTPSFLDFALPRWASDPSVPAYLADLARHEAVQIEVASLLALPKSHVPAELSLERGVAFIDAVRLLHYTFAVHRLPEDEESRQLPEAAEIDLLVYRSPEHEVRYLELGPFAAALLAGLLERRLSLATALQGAAASVALPLDDELLSRAVRLLADLAERGALLGKTASGSTEQPI